MSPRHKLTQRVATFIQDESKGTREEFNALALEVFAFQYENIPVVQELASAAGRSPENIRDWREIPAVPTAAFKHVKLFAGDESEIAHTFQSSGTSGAKKSASHFSEEGLALMDEAIYANASEMLLNDGRATRILVLAPSPKMVPTMIMAYGMQRLIEAYGLPGSGFFISPEGFESKALMASMFEAAEKDIPITLIGASFAFVHLMDQLSEKRVQLVCAPGSRTMDAGGFKDRSRVVDRQAMDAMIHERFAIPAHRNVNLLGMTELASQFYDNVLARGSAEKRHKTNSHWTRTRVLDPQELKEVQEGAGILQHLDLANVERPMVIRTEDVGEAHDGAWTVHGRLAEAEAKGCSLTVADLVREQPPSEGSL